MKTPIQKSKRVAHAALNKTETRKTWAIFQNNSLEELAESSNEERQENGGVLLTKIFVVGTRNHITGERIEEEFDDIREAWEHFAKVCFLDFMHEVEMSFRAQDTTMKDVHDFEFPAFLKPLLKLVKKLQD